MQRSPTNFDYHFAHPEPLLRLSADKPADAQHERAQVERGRQSKQEAEGP